MEKYPPDELASRFGELLRLLGDVLDGHGAPWMLVGGLAVGAHTMPRATKVLDVAVRLSAPVDSVAASLGTIGLVPFSGQLEAAAAGGVVRLATSGGVRCVVDLLCAGTEFEEQALARRIEADVLGGRFWVASADALLVYKLVAGRPQDMADIHRLIVDAGVPVDGAFVAHWVAEWGLEERWERARWLPKSDPGLEKVTELRN